MKTINIIGAGKLGKTLAYLWAKTSHYQIGGVLNSHYDSGLSAIEFIGQGNACQNYQDLPIADITLISVPDDQIALICQTLYQEYSLPKNHLVFHCAGVLNSHILKHPTREDILVGSAHPLKSFHAPETLISSYTETLCAVEGNLDAQELLIQLFNSIQSNVFKVNASQKALYHAGCVFASNYLISIAHQAINCLEASGITPDKAKQCITQLMSGTLTNIKSAELLQQALTGPLQRGDIQTINQHLHAFTSEDQKKLYQQLGLSLIELTEHETQTKLNLVKLLENN
jgi:predicted short-subunit dehydrogenase-like oxidoreductase (DUF2520 family)